jgi:hypothetical protein
MPLLSNLAISGEELPCLETRPARGHIPLTLQATLDIRVVAISLVTPRQHANVASLIGEPELVRNSHLAFETPGGPGWRLPDEDWFVEAPVIRTKVERVEGIAFTDHPVVVVDLVEADDSVPPPIAFAPVSAVAGPL